MSLREVEAALDQVLAAWAGAPGTSEEGLPLAKETERNWEGRERAMQQVRQLVLQVAGTAGAGTATGGPDKARLAACAAGVRRAGPCFLSALASLRTALVISTCTCIQDVAEPLQQLLDPLTEGLFLALFKLTGSSKRLLLHASMGAVSRLLQCTSVHPKVLLTLCQSMGDKSVNVRTAAATLLHLLLVGVVGSRERRVAYVRHGGVEAVERALIKGLADAGPAVRESMRNLYCTIEHAGLWRESMGRVLSGLEPAPKRALLKHQASWSPPASVVAAGSAAAPSTIPSPSSTATATTTSHLHALPPAEVGLPISSPGSSPVLRLATVLQTWPARRLEVLVFLRDLISSSTSSTAPDAKDLASVLQQLFSGLEDLAPPLDGPQLAGLLGVCASLDPARLVQPELLVPLLALALRLYPVDSGGSEQVIALLRTLASKHPVPMLDAMALLFCKPSRARKDRLANDQPILQLLSAMLVPGEAGLPIPEQVRAFFDASAPGNGGSSSPVRSFLLRLVPSLLVPGLRERTHDILHVLASLDPNGFARVLGTFDPDVGQQVRDALGLPEPMEEDLHAEAAAGVAAAEDDGSSLEEFPLPEEMEMDDMTMPVEFHERQSPAHAPVSVSMSLVAEAPLPPATPVNARTSAPDPQLARHDSKLDEMTGLANGKPRPAAQARQPLDALKMSHFNPGTPTAAKEVLRKRVYDGLFAAATPVQKQPAKGAQDLDALLGRLEDVDGLDHKTISASTIRRLFRLAMEGSWSQEQFGRCWTAMRRILRAPAPGPVDIITDPKAFLLLLAKELLLHQPVLFQGEEEELLSVCLECLLSPSNVVAAGAYDVLASLPHALDPGACVRATEHLLAAGAAGGGDPAQHAFLLQLLPLLLRTGQVTPSSELQALVFQSLNDPEPDVRKSAVDCCVQFGLLLEPGVFATFLGSCTTIQRRMIQLYMDKERARSNKG